MNGDVVLLRANAQGFAQYAVDFYHLSENCSLDGRYLPNFNGPGFAFVGQVFGSFVVYSRVVDPRGTIVQPLAVETVLPDENINALGTCIAMSGIPAQSMGPTVIAPDAALGALLPPFSLR